MPPVTAARTENSGAFRCCPEPDPPRRRAREELPHRDQIPPTGPYLIAVGGQVLQPLLVRGDADLPGVGLRDGGRGRFGTCGGRRGTALPDAQRAEVQGFALEGALDAAEEAAALLPGYGRRARPRQVYRQLIAAALPTSRHARPPRRRGRGRGRGRGGGFPAGRGAGGSGAAPGAGAGAARLGGPPPPAGMGAQSGAVGALEAAGGPGAAFLDGVCRTVAEAAERRVADGARAAALPGNSSRAASAASPGRVRALNPQRCDVSARGRISGPCAAMERGIQGGNSGPIPLLVLLAGLTQRIGSSVSARLTETARW